MKRFIAMFLVFSIVLSLSGCYIDTDEFIDSVGDEISKEVDKMVDKAKTEVSNKVDEVVGEAKTEVNKIKENVSNSGKKRLITFDATEGMGGPTEQKFKIGTCPKITDEKPTRVGYHFVGWTSIAGSNEPVFFSGKKTRYEFTEDTKLYACWEAYNTEDPFAVSRNNGKTMNLFGKQTDVIVEHNYRKTTENKGKIIRIQCDCGYEHIDRTITLDAFVNITTNGKKKTYDSLTKTKKKKYTKEHILYCTQDFGPAAVLFIGSFYASIESGRNNSSSSYNAEEYDVPLSINSDFFETLQAAAEFDSHYAKICNVSDEEVFAYINRVCGDVNSGVKTTDVLSNMSEAVMTKQYRNMATTHFSKIAETGENAVIAIAILRAINLGYQAFSSDELLSTQTLSLVKAIHAITGIVPYVGDYYEQLFITLEAGLVLYDKVIKHRNGYQEFLAAILDDDGSAIPGTTLTLGHVDEARNKNFTNAPSVGELLSSLSQPIDEIETTAYSLLSSREKTIVVWYLTMRLDYDFQQEYGISLDDYIKYIE